MSDKFNRTRHALAVYDAFTVDVWEKSPWNRWQEIDKEHTRLARLVGRAFGEETSEVNSPETCEACVTPKAVRKFLVNESWKGTW